MVEGKTILENPKTDGSLFQVPDKVDEDVVGLRRYGGYILEARDPYGFFYIKSKTKLPDDLSGQFTGADEAIRAIEAYNNKQKLLGKR